MRNKFAGNCLRCGVLVPIGGGHPERQAGRWFIRCLACVGKPPRSLIEKDTTTSPEPKKENK